MRADRVAELLRCYRLPLIETRFAADAEAASKIAAELDAPIALKASSPGLLHKSDAGGVLLDLAGDEIVRAGAAEIQVPSPSSRVRTRRTAGSANGSEGCRADRRGGPRPKLWSGDRLRCRWHRRRACMKDVAVRITPIGAAEAASMIRSLRSFPLLDGYRGAERCARHGGRGCDLARSARWSRLTRRSQSSTAIP